jgi:hypothetical protein
MMRAHTTSTTKSRPRRKAPQVIVALALGICALAVPASAYADPQPYRSPEAVIAAADSSGPPPYRSPEAVIAAADSVAGPSPSAPTLVSSPTDPSNGFDWGSAAVGAGAAMALVALGGAGFLTVRRRTAVSSSAASMS